MRCSLTWRTSSRILGSVFIWLDYGTPLEPLREEARRICKSSPEWDGHLCLVQVTEAGERAMKIRVLVSAADSSLAWDLRCKMREGLIDFIRANHPESLPVLRAVVTGPVQG